jgi:hypothetical protein
MQNFCISAFAKSRKAVVSAIMSVRLSVRLSVSMEQLVNHWKDFHEIWYLIIFLKSAEKIKALFKSDKNNGYLT